jgi:hypothetical protein
MTSPYEVGYRVALREISQGTASFTRAQQRSIYEGDSNSRMEWDQGYDDCVCAYRLGHDVEAMVRTGLLGPSLLVTSAIVEGLLDGCWHLILREDPRQESLR